MKLFSLSSPYFLSPLPSSSSSSPSSKTQSLFPKSSFHGVRLRATVAAAPPPLSSRGGGPLVVRMAKREEELKEIRTKMTEEINEEIVDLKGELLMLRLQRSARNEFKSSEFGRMRKRIARMLTVRREREIEEGINKRLSRKLDKRWKRSIVVRPPPSLRKKQERRKASAPLHPWQRPRRQEQRAMRARPARQGAGLRHPRSLPPLHPSLPIPFTSRPAMSQEGDLHH